MTRRARLRQQDNLMLAVLVAIAVAFAGCGGGGGSDNSSTANSASFPSPKGKTVAQLTKGLPKGPVVAPTVHQIDRGKARYGFGLFTVDQKQVTGARVALYLERSGTSTVTGPYVATEESLEVAPPYRSKTVSNDPAAAKSFYAARIDVPKPGVYAVVALSRIGGRLVASSPVGARVLRHDPVPGVGDKPPRITTLTVASAHGDVASIDTRQPHDDMHKVNFADVYGKKPIVLLFATPALCQSRTCAPVTDVTVAVEAQHRGDNVAFIHNEIYKGNTIKSGCLEGKRPVAQCYTPQLLAFNLQTEPFLFVIDRHGRIAARIEGAFSKSELERALEPVLR